MNGPEPIPCVPWRDDFRIGIAAVDHEHREMVGLINRIFVRLASGDPADVIADDLGEVYARISAHFALEERVMQDKRYDQFADHKDDHERLLDDIREIMEAHESGTYEYQKGAFAARLEEWFVAHFKTKDARLHKTLGV
jgi:hemerythrin-like metal-binding protein